MKRLKYAAVMLLSGNLAFAGVPATKKELAQSCLKHYLSRMNIENDNEEIKLVALNITQSVDESNRNGTASFVFARKDKSIPGVITTINGSADYDFERRDTADRPQKCIPLRYPYVMVIKSIKMGK
jgi:hypothetical protein